MRVIQGRVDNKAEEMATDFLDELEARGVKDANDYGNKQEIVKETVESIKTNSLNGLKNNDR